MQRKEWWERRKAESSASIEEVGLKELNNGYRMLEL